MEELVTSNATDATEAERIKEVIRKLNLALVNCREFLDEVERRLQEPNEGGGQRRLTH